MSDILKIYTQDQLYEMWRQKIIAKKCGITDFNDGSSMKALVQSSAEIVSSVSMDMLNGLKRGITLSLYEGLGFPKKTAQNAYGYIRPYRKPAIILRYAGNATSVRLTINNSTISCVCYGAPSDAFSLTLSAYSTTDALASALDALSNWVCVCVTSGIQTSSLWKYTDKELIGSIDYKMQSGFDVMTESDIAIQILSGYSITIDSMEIQTTVDSLIPGGQSGVTIKAKNMTAGIIGNIKSNAIDIENGKGTINSSLGISYAINDSAFSGGSEEETEDERKNRFKETIQALNAGTKSGIVSSIKNINSVRNADMRSSYPTAGTNTIVVDDGSGTISSTLRAEVEKVLYGDPDDFDNYPGKNAEGITYVLAVPTIIEIPLSITIKKLQKVFVDIDQMKIDVSNAITRYINTLRLGADVILSEVIRVAKNANSGVYDAVVTTPNDNVTINANEFARTGAGTSVSVTVTVVVVSNE